MTEATKSSNHHLEPKIAFIDFRKVILSILELNSLKWILISDEVQLSKSGNIKMG